MAFVKVIWIVAGLCIQYQHLAADKPEGVSSFQKDDETNAGLTKHVEESKSDQEAIEESTESDGGYNSELENIEDNKRGFGKWRNMKWLKTSGKRNIGRWRNRNWQTMKDYALRNEKQTDYGHSLNKRFSDEDNDIEPAAYFSDDYDGYGILKGDYIVPGPYRYLDYNELADDDFEDLHPGNYIEKRHGSRWNLIHRKLAELRANSKREIDSPDVEKRMNSRWRIIQSKLNQLRDGYNKRFAGRWRNQNWLLQQSKQDQNAKMGDPHNVKKRFIGRWKNNNWLLRKYADQ